MTTLTLGLDFVLIWTIILGVGVFFYVLLDGFDLGVGILFGLLPDTASRNLAMNSIVPIWDGKKLGSCWAVWACWQRFPLLSRLSCLPSISPF